MPGISLDDKGAWDDSALIKSWDEAVAEYEKYHSIQASGKRLEDVLSQDELRELQNEHGDLIEVEVNAEETADRNSPADHEAEAAQQANGDGALDPQGDTTQERAASDSQEYSGCSETATAHDGHFAFSMPQALLGTVQDENMRNLMMSWYYAGYYTGLLTGQQQGASKTAAPEDQN